MGLIVKILDTRKRRLSLQREADLLEQEEKALMGTLINDMNARGLSTLKDEDDGVTEVAMTTTMEPMATEWPKVLDYIIANDAVDLLQKRLTASAVKARWENGEIIPGIVSTAKQSIKFNV
jgi:hypothetical protein